MRYFFILLLFPTILLGQEADLLQAKAMKQFTSEAKESLGETRQTLGVAPDGQLIDNSGETVSYADVIALEIASSNVSQIADASIAGAKAAMDVLYSKTNEVADAAFLIRVVVPPLDEREALTAFVVDVVSDGTNDLFYVWYNKQLAISPNRDQYYQLLDSTQAVKAVWRDNWDGTSYTPWRLTYNSTDPKLILNSPTFDSSSSKWHSMSTNGLVSLSCDGVATNTYLRMEAVEGKGSAVWHREPDTVKGWVMEGHTLERSGLIWEGVHCCSVKRPDFAIGLPCQHIRNDKWGLGKNGFAFGGLTPLVNGKIPYTGMVSNRITGEIMGYFKDGFNSAMPKEISEGGEEQ